MQEIDWYFIVVSAILVIVLVFVNVYMIAYYGHSQDSKFATSFFMKFVVVGKFRLIDQACRSVLSL